MEVQSIFKQNLDSKFIRPKLIHFNTFLLLSDINECLQPNACGVNTNCINLPGNYTCQCKDGYIGTNPYDGCADLDECADPNACGPGAICTNLEGSYRCDCPEGFVGDPHTVLGCTDLDECTTPNSRGVAPCGRNALCYNEVGSFKCACPEGYIGDPTVDCQGKCLLINQQNLNDNYYVYT